MVLMESQQENPYFRRSPKKPPPVHLAGEISFQVDQPKSCVPSNGSGKPKPTRVPRQHRNLEPRAAFSHSHLPATQLRCETQHHGGVSKLEGPQPGANSEVLLGCPPDGRGMLRAAGLRLEARRFSPNRGT